MKKRNLLIILGFILGFLTIFFFPRFTLADYPEKPVTLIVSWGVGGSNDAVARQIAENMKKYFPKPLVVVNRPGGAGTVGMAELVSAKPDGYTLGSMGMTTLTVNPHMMELPFKTPNDYTSLALVGTQPFVIIVNSDSPFKTLKDLVEYAKANPGKLRFGTAGAGSAQSLALGMLKFKAQIDVSEVYFTGGGERIAALMGKHIELSLSSLFETMPQLQAGKLRVLAICEEKRNSSLPEVPTVKELGYDVVMSGGTLLVGPKGLPSDVVSTFLKSYRKVSEDSTFLKSMEKLGYDVVYEDTENLSKRLWKEYLESKTILERLGQKK